MFLIRDSFRLHGTGAHVHREGAVSLCFYFAFLKLHRFDSYDTISSAKQSEGLRSPDPLFLKKYDKPRG